MPHYFTLSEANTALEIIKPLMEEVQRIRTEILDRQPGTWDAVQRVAGNGGSPALSKLVKDFDRLNDLLHQILATGAELKDVNTGLLDFVALRNGRPVCLCWKFGEDQIEYWHEMDAGFAGRQSIDVY